MKTVRFKGSVLEVPDRMRASRGLQIMLPFVQPEETNHLRVAKILDEACGFNSGELLGRDVGGPTGTVTSLARRIISMGSRKGVALFADGYAEFNERTPRSRVDAWFKAEAERILSLEQFWPSQAYTLDDATPCASPPSDTVDSVLGSHLGAESSDVGGLPGPYGEE